jgi:hypothetical protein
MRKNAIIILYIILYTPISAMSESKQQTLFSDADLKRLDEIYSEAKPTVVPTTTPTASPVATRVTPKWGPGVVSGPLVFVKPEYGDAKDQLLACTILVESKVFMQHAYKAWNESYRTGRRMVQKMLEADDEAHRVNATRLAERVYHKYLKWGAKRFSADVKHGSCFYTGEQCFDSRDRKIAYDPVFVAKMIEVAGPLASKIMTELHISEQCALRFADFIKLECTVEFLEDRSTRYADSFTSPFETEPEETDGDETDGDDELPELALDGETDDKDTEAAKSALLDAIADMVFMSMQGGQPMWGGAGDQGKSPFVSAMQAGGFF